MKAWPSRSGVGRRSAEGSFGGLVLGGGDREEGFLEHRAGEGGVHGESAVDLAVPVVADVSRVAAPRRRVPRVPAGLASWASAASGEATSRMWRPRCLRALASWSAARSSRWCSAFSTTSGSRSSGRSARARRIASACSTCTRPAARAARVRSRPSRAVGEPHRPVGSGRRVVRVRWACQLAVEVAPVAAATSMRSAWASSRAFELGELGLGGLDLIRWWRWSRRRPSTTAAPWPPRQG